MENTVAIASSIRILYAVLFYVTVTNDGNIYVNWRSNSDCSFVLWMNSIINHQYGDVIILPSLIPTLRSVPSESVLKKTIEKST